MTRSVEIRVNDEESLPALMDRAWTLVQKALACSDSRVCCEQRLIQYRCYQRYGQRNKGVSR